MNPKCVGLGKSLKELGDNDIGRVMRALHGQVFPGICTTCKSSGELKQEMMMVREYLAKFIELACFMADYMGTNMDKVRKFEDGLKLSIQGKIMGLIP